MPHYSSILSQLIYALTRLFEMPKRKSPEDFFKKTRENGSEDSKDIKGKDNILYKV
jgi:hypothetical protein